MKVAVVGGRDFQDYETLKAELDTHKITQIISGGARGADKLAHKYASEKNISFKKFLPNWQLHGKSAGPRRNELIVEACEKMIAFWDGQSRGTAHSINCAKSKGKEVTVIGYTKQDSGDKEPT